jgi:hypothetical protein
MAPLRLAILDDYQRVALSSADWASVQAKIQIDVFEDTLLDEDRLAERLKPYAIVRPFYPQEKLWILTLPKVCTMRERTKISASLLDKLPNLKLITTSAFYAPITGTF